MQTTILITLLLALLAFILFSKPRKALPPGATPPDGPPRKPLVGNLPDIPPHHSWLKFYEWSKSYGPLFRLDIAGRNHVFVSSEEIANDLLREKGSIYSSREQMPMAVQLMSDGLRPVFLPYGDVWRNVRKLMHNLCNVNVAVTYEPVQEEESLRAVRDLCREPRSYEKWFERYAAGLILRLAYSTIVYTGDEPLVRRILKVVHAVERVASPGAYLVDTFPSLMLLPPFLAPFKREGAELHAEELDLFRTCLRDGVEASKNNVNGDNFCGKWAANKHAYDISDDHVAYTIGTLFEAGAGTTSNAMASFMLCMVLHPEEFKKLQAEVDSVVGPERLPSFTDIPSLPRVRAVGKETLRWRPVTAGGLPHMSTQDDVYEMPDGRKIFLEAGTNVHPVQWSIHREPERYPDAESFRPERWLEEGWPTFKEPLSQYPNLSNFSAFGFGRRICPGQNIAERSLYILIARIAWACDISQKKDKAGKPLPPPLYEYITGFNVQPKPFDFDLQPRQDRRKTLKTQYDLVWGQTSNGGSPEGPLSA